MRQTHLLSIKFKTASLKLITYNVNGIRAALKKGLLEWIKDEDPDLFCVQETKSQPDQIPEELFGDLGYHAYWHSAEKKGYSGVLTFSKTPATKVVEGMGKKKYDVEGRVLRTDFENFTLVNMYLPSSTSGEERHLYKMAFLKDFGKWISKLIKEKQEVIVVGDYNIVRLDIDIHNPTRKDKPPGFRPEERKWIQDLFNNEFVDAFRIINPEVPDEYSWWSYRAGARKNNKGWRIDYVAVTENLAKKVTAARHGHEAVHSDHAAVIVEAKW